MTNLTTVAITVIAIHAVSSDVADVLQLSSEDTIVVSADESWENLENDEIHFRGNVEIRSPQWALMANQIVVYGDLEAVKRIVADGSPVFFIVTSAPENSGKRTVGEGSHLEYNRDTGLLRLLGNASVSSDGHIMRSSEIQYDIEQQELKAGGPEGVHISFEPDSASET